MVARRVVKENVSPGDAVRTAVDEIVLVMPGRCGHHAQEGQLHVGVLRLNGADDAPALAFAKGERRLPINLGHPGDHVVKMVLLVAFSSRGYIAQADGSV